MRCKDPCGDFSGVSLSLFLFSTVMSCKEKKINQCLGIELQWRLHHNFEHHELKMISRNRLFRCNLKNLDRKTSLNFSLTFHLKNCIESFEVKLPEFNLEKTAHVFVTFLRSSKGHSNKNDVCPERRNILGSLDTLMRSLYINLHHNVHDEISEHT